MILLLTLICIGIGIYWAGMFFPNKNVITTVCIGFSTFLSTYILCSGFLFWIDIFSIIKALLFVFGVGTAGCVMLYIRGNRFKVLFDFSQYILPLVIILLLIPCVLVRYELFGMGQDEGGYQTKALFLLNGYNDNKYTFDEYHYLDENVQEEYKDFLTIFTGFYNTDFLGIGVEIGEDEATGVFHGIPTAAAVFALSAGIFGVSGMSVINIFVYICILWFLYLLCLKINMSKLSGIAAILITGLSPIILWVAKSTLTEIILALLMVMYLYFLADEEKNIYYSVLPIAVFSFYHCSIYVFIPMFVCIYLVLYLKSRKNEYAIAAIASVVSFAAGYYMMLTISLHYVVMNSGRVLLGVLPWWVLYLMPVLFISITCIAVFVLKRCVSFKLLDLEKSVIMKWVLRIIVIVAIIGVIHCVLTLWDYSAYESLYSKFNKMRKNIGFTPTIASCLSTGMYLYPMAIIYLFVKPGKFLQKEYISITMSFVYIVLFVNVFLRRDIAYYFYFCRYLAYSIPLLALMIALFLENLTHKKIAVFLCLFGLWEMWPIDDLLITTKDDTRMEWDALISVSESIPDQTAVLFEGDEFTQVAALAIKAMTGADIYPVSEDVNEQAEKLSSQYTHVYMIIDSTDELGYEIVCREKYTESQDNISRNRREYSPIPYVFEQQQHTVTVYNVAVEE